MPTILLKKEVKTLQEFSKFVEQRIGQSTENILWFRGSGNIDYQLKASLFRNPNYSTSEEFLDLEKKVIARFLHRSIPFLPRPLNKDDDWDVLFFMQHYQIPSRLLDWSENPFIALYFALTGSKFSHVSNSFENDVAVWFLDPVAWNRYALSDVSFREGILSIDNRFIDGYKPGADIEFMKDHPVAMFGTHNSARIVAQRGVFTISGKSLDSFEDIYAGGYPTNSLIKVIIKKDKIKTLLDSLTSIGITDSVVYPDLFGFSLELKRFFKFNV